MPALPVAGNSQWEELTIGYLEQIAPTLERRGRWTRKGLTIMSETSIADIIRERGLDPRVTRDDGTDAGDLWQEVYSHGELDQPITWLKESQPINCWIAGDVVLIDDNYESRLRTISGPVVILVGRAVSMNSVLDQCAELLPAYLAKQTDPGIYRLRYDPTDETVDLYETFSGDNSYIPGDNRITLAYADVRESSSLLDVGLDEDGDIIDTDTTSRFLHQIEDRLDEMEKEEN